MKSKIIPIIGGLLILLACSRNLPLVTIKTTLGDITVEVDTLNAPVTANNFLKLVRKGVYAEGATFYRAVRMDNQPFNQVKIEVVQGGLKHDSLIEMHPPIVHEGTRQTGLKHKNGVISMARMEPGTASTEIFICIGYQPELDYGGKRNPDLQGFAAFGRVVKGMQVVKQIQQLPDTSQYLIEPIQFTGVEVK